MFHAKLNANNNSFVSGKNYTELEHNWDEAYATFTLSKAYAGTATSTSNGGEKMVAAYAWEYGRSNATTPDYLKIHPAFLKGRAAIVNNDIAEAKKQAVIIKAAIEKAFASAAVGYLNKWKTSIVTTPGTAAKQFAEGLGFIYSLRFCKYNGVDDTFSDGLLNDLVYSSTNGYWELTNAKADAAIAKIKVKFGL